MFSSKYNFLNCNNDNIIKYNALTLLIARCLESHNVNSYIHTNNRKKKKQFVYQN